MNEKELLVALREEAKAQGGIATLSKKTGLTRNSLYKSLSAKGDPKWSTLCAVISALEVDLNISVQESV